MWAARLKVVSAAGSLEPLADPTMDRVLTPAFRNANPQVWAALRNTIVEVLPLGLTQCAQALQEFDVAELLRGIRVPTMVACGDGDVATPPAEAKRIAGLIPGARYVEFGDARHYPNVEQARQFNAVLIEWLNSQQQPWG
jgi:3-oxoadipate enol-lactonase